ncbi:MAG: outer membrane beta-barrel protein [Candidatus Marinimicrobia bacterium]|nr:outer membrane beta-barrel protein [Candidatus Neomarinimicrobiota bacterium]
MKNVLLLALVFQPLIVQAQILRYGMTFGILPNTATSESHYFTHAETPLGFSSRTTYAVGVVALLHLRDEVLINSAAKFTSKSVSTHRVGEADGPVFMTLMFNYLSLVSKVQYRLLNGLIIGAGPVLDVNLNSRLEATGDFPAIQKPIPETKKIRFGVIVSIGYLIDLGIVLAVLPELSYDVGLSNTNDAYGGRYSSIEFSISFLLR